MHKRLAALLITLVTVIGLVSCAGIPMSGPVNKGGAVAQADTGYVQFFPEAPADGASKEAILRGFIEASSSTSDDFAIARLFLAPSIRSTWDPNAHVVVDDDSRSISVSGDAAQLLTGKVANVSAFGEFTEFETTQPVSSSYQFERVQGQWRLSEVPPGIVIDATTFEQVFESHALYFFDPTFSYLVPDLRWYARGNTTSTRIVKTLMSGPSPWLATPNAVSTAFTPKITLATESVPVVDGIAAVNLSDAILTLSPLQKQRIRQQLAASLTTVNGITAVAILVDGAMQSNQVSSPLDMLVPEPVESQPLVLTNRKFGFLLDNTVTALPGLSAAVVGLDPSAATYSAGLGSVVALNNEGVLLVQSGQDPLLLDNRSGLVAPSIDWMGFVWSVPRENPAALLAFDREGVKLAISTPWPDASSISALKVSRDGTRVAALINDGAGTHLEVAGITRNDQLQPVALGEPLIIKTFSTGMVDLTWVNAQNIAVVGTASASTSSVTVYAVGGMSIDKPVIGSGEISSIAGANLISQLKALDSSGQLFDMRGANLWQVLLSDVRTLATVQ